MQSKLIRNIATIASSTVLTQAAMLAVMPLLTRVYPPETFGLFAVFSSIHAIMLILSTLKYDMAIVIPADYKTSQKLLFLSSALSIVFSIATLLCLIVIYMAKPGELSPYYFLVPISVVFAVIYSNLQQWGARHCEYQNYAASQIVNTAGNLLTSVAIALALPKSVNGLIIGFLVGVTAGGIYLIIVWRRRRDQSPFHDMSITAADLKSTARSYANMPRYVLPFTVLLVISQNLTPVVLSHYYNLAEVGYFAVASRILLAPASVFGGAIGEPFRAELAARLRNQLEVGTMTRKIIMTLTTAGITGFGIIFVFAPWFFPLFFGPGYQSSSLIAQAICIGALGQFIALPVTYTFIMTGHLKIGLGTMAAVAAIPSGALIIAAQRFAMTEALFISSTLLFATSMILVYLAYRCALNPNATPSVMEPQE